MAGFAVRSSEFEAWQAAEAEAYRRELTGALERLARGRAAVEAWAAAIRAAQRWLEFDGLDEPAHVVLMSALAAAGEPSAALQQYRECVRILDAELGVAPLAGTTALAEEIRDGRSVPAARSGVVPTTSGPTSGLGSRPTSPGRLVGRATELAGLFAGYSAVGPDGRLLLIEGEAGIGKTRLGAELAEQVRGSGGALLRNRKRRRRGGHRLLRSSNSFGPGSGHVAEPTASVPWAPTCCVRQRASCLSSWTRVGGRAWPETIHSVGRDCSRRWLRSSRHSPRARARAYSGSTTCT